MSATPTPQPSILVIDDESGILDTLRILLKNEGFDVATAQGLFERRLRARHHGGGAGGDRFFHHGANRRAGTAGDGIDHGQVDERGDEGRDREEEPVGPGQEGTAGLAVDGGGGAHGCTSSPP